MADSDHRVRRWRKEQVPAVSLQELAKRVSTTKATLSRVESGKLALSLDLGKRLSDTTGIPLRELCPELAEMFDARADQVGAPQ